MITGATVTDEQIRGLMERAWQQYADACHALGFSPVDGRTYDAEETREYRYRCAVHLNEHATCKVVTP